MNAENTRPPEGGPDVGPAGERWIVDALEPTPGGTLARLERPDGTTCDLPLAALPAGVAEGDVLAVQRGPEGLVATSLPRQTAGLREAAQARLDALNAGSPGTEGPDIEGPGETGR